MNPDKPGVLGSLLPRRLQTLGVLLLAACLLNTSFAAAEETQRVAVLRLHGDLDIKVLLNLTDSVREGVLTALRPPAYQVMTRENMASLARDNDIDLSALLQGGEDEVDTCRSLKAQLCLSGSLTEVGSKLSLTLWLHDTMTASPLGHRDDSFAGVDELKAALSAVSEALVREGLNLPRKSRRNRSSGAAVQEGEIGEDGSTYSVDRTAREALVRFESTPAGRVVVRLDGDLLCQRTPCSKRVAIGLRQVAMESERYHPVNKEILIKEGMEPVAMMLDPQFARLTVTTEPPELAVLVDEERVVAADGLRARMMDPGEHELLIDDECYLRRGQRIGLKEGDERTVHLVAKPRRAGLRVDIEDDSGNSLDGSIWVDGEELGPAPGPFDVRLCAKQVEVQTSAGGQWSKRFSPGDLAENEATELLARVARDGGPSEGLESFIEWAKAKYGATFCEEHYFDGCYSARGEDQCLAWVGVWFKDCAQLRELPPEIPMARYPALGAGLDSCARRESVQTMKKYLQPTLECSRLHSEKEKTFGP